LRELLGAVPVDRDVLMVSGDDAVTFLQGQLSQDVAALDVGASAWSLLLQPQGKVDAWLRVTRRAPDELMLDVDGGWGDAVEARLRRFLLRTKASIDRLDWRCVAIRGPGASDLGLPGELAVGWQGIDGVDLVGPDAAAPEGVRRCTADDLDAARIEAGVPRMGAELDESTIPAEAGRWLIDASVSFSKGCYTGQELVARIDSRGGNVPRHLRGVLLADGALAGAEVVRAGDVVGRLTSVALESSLGQPIALALLARKVEPGDEVAVADTTGRVADLPLAR
jgi:folate-binding protein YgfZ